MDSFSTSLLHSLTEAVAALQPNVGASVSLRDVHGNLIESTRAGSPDALAHLPSLCQPCTETGVDASLSDGWSILHVPLRGRLPKEDTAPLGVVRLVSSAALPQPLVTAVETLTTHAAIALEQNELHQELQHSFNGLFIVYEAGHLLNFSHTADDVFSHVIGLLTRTLHFTQCAVMLLRSDTLVPAAHAGLDPQWVSECRLPFSDTFAAQVHKAGVAAQFEEAVNLDGVILPQLANGTTPASILCAPLTTRAGTLGFLEVYWSAPEPISDDAIFVVSVLAVEMAAALENAHLYEALREREEQLTQYAAKLVNSQEDERRRISRDIHDGLGQMIVSAFQYLQAHEYSLPESHPREAFARGLSVLQECIRETRRVMSDLRPSTLDDFGLVVALQQQLDAAAQEEGWDAHFKVDGSASRLAPAVETTVFRVVQEALNNARKHAQATRVEVMLQREENEVVVEVRDWGRGFAVGGVAARPERGEHLGLMGMRERASLLGGTVDVTSIPGSGTTVRIVLPAFQPSH